MVLGVCGSKEAADLPLLKLEMHTLLACVFQDEPSCTSYSE